MEQRAQDALVEAVSRMVMSAVAASAHAPLPARPAFAAPSARSLGTMADGISDLSLQTGASIRDVAYVTLTAAAAAARVADMDFAELSSMLLQLADAPMFRPALEDGSITG